jgi:hypothetical protein
MPPFPPDGRLQFRRGSRRDKQAERTSIQRVSPFARTPDINVEGFAFAVNNETIHVDPPSVVVIPYGCVREPAAASKAACNAGLPWRAGPPAAVRKGLPTFQVSEIVKILCFGLCGFGVHACTRAPWRRREVASARPRGVPTLGTKWKGRSAAEVCTSEARKIGETACARERAAPS